MNESIATNKAQLMIMIMMMMIMMITLLISLLLTTVRYNVIILAITYVLPILLMSFTYFCIGKELWGSKMIGEKNKKIEKSMESKQKVRMMMSCLILSSSICNLIIFLHCFRSSR